MNAIVAVTRDWGIGRDGGLLVRNREDMCFFRRMTMGGTVVCGRKTFQSFPGGALKGRRNVVVSSDKTFNPDGVCVVRSLEEALAAVAEDDPESVWLIGGESIYRQLLPFCNRAYVTKNDVLVEADAFFPNLDELDDWVVQKTEDGGVTPSGVPFAFVVYVSKKGVPLSAH